MHPWFLSIPTRDIEFFICLYSIKLSALRHRIQKKDLLSVYFTGRQPPHLYSVLYGIISKRRSVLAAQVLLREKSGAYRVGTDSNIPCLPCGSLIFILWKLKMSYHTDYPNWDCSVVVCHLFLYSFICAPTPAFACFVTLLYITTL
jgi:hypothetical protein